MIKKHSILLLSTFFVLSALNTSLAMEGGKYKKDAKAKAKQWPTVQPAIMVQPATNLSQADTKSKEEQTGATQCGAGAPGASATDLPKPAATTLAIAAKDAKANAEDKAQKEPKKEVTLEELNARKAWTSIDTQKRFGYKYDGIVIAALEQIKPDEVLKDQESTTVQSSLGRAVSVFKEHNNEENAKRFTTLVSQSALALDASARKDTRKVISGVRDAVVKARKAEYAQKLAELQAIAATAGKEIAELNGYVNQTYQLSGKLNLDPKEISYINGNKAALTEVEQDALAKKLLARQEKGISDNEEDQPEAVNPDAVVAKTADQLFELKPGAQKIIKKKA